MSIGIPIVFLIICAFLVFMPLYVEPVQVGMGILITVIGVPVYLVGVHWRNKPQWFNEFMRKSSELSTEYSQLVTNAGSFLNTGRRKN